VLVNAADQHGKMVRAVMHAGKTGYVYVHDRKSIRADSDDRHVVRARKDGDDLLMHCAVYGFVSLACADLAPIVTIVAILSLAKV